MLLRQVDIDQVPLGLKCSTEDDRACFLRHGFQFIESGLGLQGGDISGWQVEGGELVICSEAGSPTRQIKTPI